MEQRRILGPFKLRVTNVLIKPIACQVIARKTPLRKLIHVKVISTKTGWRAFLCLFGLLYFLFSIFITGPTQYISHTDGTI